MISNILVLVQPDLFIRRINLNRYRNLFNDNISFENDLHLPKRILDIYLFLLDNITHINVCITNCYTYSYIIFS